MLRLLVLACVLWGHAAAAAPAEKKVHAWLVRCDDSCVISQDFMDEGHLVRVEIDVQDGANMFRLVLPAQARHSEEIFLTTRYAIEMRAKPVCDEVRCIATHGIDSDWLAKVMHDDDLFVMFDVSEKASLRARFSWSGIVDAILTARSRG